MTSVDRAREEVNQRIDLLGIVACRVNATAHARDVVAQLRGAYGAVVLEQTVRETIRLAEAPAARLPILRYAPSSPAANDYGAVAGELLAVMGVTENLA